MSFRNSAFVLAKKSRTLLLSRELQVNKAAATVDWQAACSNIDVESGDRYRVNEKVKVGSSRRSGCDYGLGAGGEWLRRHRQHASPKTEVKIPFR